MGPDALIPVNASTIDPSLVSTRPVTPRLPKNLKHALEQNGLVIHGFDLQDMATILDIGVFAPITCLHARVVRGQALLV